jgi:hypothetical protein
MRHGILILILLAVGGGARLRAADAVAADMRNLLGLAFADASAAIKVDPDRACAQVERTRQVFGPLVTEYSTRSGDPSFRNILRGWFYTYCGYGPEKSAPSDGD